MTMGRRRKKKVSVGHFSAFVETAANKLFQPAEAIDTPKFVYCYKIWDRFCIAAVLDKQASEVPLMALDSVRKLAQKRYKQPVCLIMLVDPPDWNWQASEDRVIALLEAEGGEAE